jgi:hypothetical protein
MASVLTLSKRFHGMDYRETIALDGSHATWRLSQSHDETGKNEASAIRRRGD